MEKVYIALYTCGSSRAVHLDVVPDLSEETFSRGFKRFICRRGIPRLTTGWLLRTVWDGVAVGVAAAAKIEDFAGELL